MELKNILSILKIARGKGSYPIFSSYLHSDGKEISTSGYDTYARFSYKLPFKGDIEFALLEKYLLLEDVEFKSIGDILNVGFKNTKTKLNIQHFDFPYQYKPKKEGITVNSELISVIKTAAIYAGTKTPFVYIGKDYILSGNDNAVFKYRIKSDVENPIFFSKEYIKVLMEGCKIFLHKNICFVEYDNGFFCFVMPSKKYNIELVSEQVDKSVKGSKFIGSIAPIKDALKSIEPIFANELEKEVRIVNKNGRVELIGGSYINGISSVLTDIGVEIDFDFVVDMKILKNISLDYYLYKPKIENRLLLKSNISDSYILIAVEDK